MADEQDNSRCCEQCYRIVSEQELNKDQVGIFLNTVQRYADVMLVDVEEEMLQGDNDDTLGEVKHYSVVNKDYQKIFIYEISAEEVDEEAGDKIAEDLFRNFDNVSFSFEANMGDML